MARPNPQTSADYGGGPLDRNYNNFAMDKLMEGSDDQPSDPNAPPAPANQPSEKPSLDPQIQDAVNKAVAKAFQSAAQTLAQTSLEPEPEDDSASTPGASNVDQGADDENSGALQEP